MTIYNGRRMRKRRTRAELWDYWWPVVFGFELAVLMALLWWPLHLMGMV